MTKPEKSALSDMDGYKRGYEDSFKGLKRGPVTIGTVNRIIDSYENFGWDKREYIQGYCDAACDKNDIDCRIPKNLNNSHD